MKTAKILNDSPAYEILSVVEEIPFGKVATYGQIACFIGMEKNSRLVAMVFPMPNNMEIFHVTEL